MDGFKTCPTCFGKGEIRAPLESFPEVCEEPTLEPIGFTTIPMECPTCFGHRVVERVEDVR